jgi:hypothetical protein
MRFISLAQFYIDRDRIAKKNEVIELQDLCLIGTLFVARRLDFLEGELSAYASTLDEELVSRQRDRTNLKQKWRLPLLNHEIEVLEFLKSRLQRKLEKVQDNSVAAGVRKNIQEGT